MGPMIALFLFTVRQTLLSRKIWLAILMLSAPTALSLLVRLDTDVTETRQHWEAYHGIAQFFLVMVIMPIVCMIYGVSLVSADVEAKTISYLITRKMRRFTVLAVKFLAVAVVVVLICNLGMIALHSSWVVDQTFDPNMHVRGELVQWNPTSDLMCYITAITFGMPAMLALFTLISLTTAKPMTYSVLYLFVVEVSLSNLPIEARIYSLMHPIRMILVRQMPEIQMLYEIPPKLADQIYGHWGGSLILLAVLILAMTIAGILMTFRELQPTRIVRE